MDLTGLLNPLAPPLCWDCGSVAPRGQPLCPRCRALLRWLDAEPVALRGVAAWAPVAYEGPARALVGALKFRGAAKVADAMAAQIVAGAPAGFLAGSTLVPVPLHPARLRARGFNQAERLAEAISARSDSVTAGCLKRTGTAGTQMGRPRAARLVALEGAFVASASAPDRVTLVDDVITTGATLSACAAALRQAGSRRIAALAYARTPTR